MFLAGYTPGILMTAAMMVTVYIISKKEAMNLQEKEWQDLLKF